MTADRANEPTGAHSDDLRRPTRAWWIRLGAIVLVGIVLRLVAIGVATNMGHSPVRGDAITYDGLALSLAAGHGYLHEGRTDNVRPPLWPFVLSLVYRAAGHQPLAAAGLQAVLDGASMVAVALLTLALGAPLAAALVAAALFAAWPGAIFMNIVLYTEPVFTLLVLLTMIAIVTQENAPTLARGATTGLMFGLLGLTRQTTLWFLPAYAVVAPWLVGRRDRAAVLARVLALVVCVGVLTPWTVRDQVLHGHVTWLSDYSGLNLWIGNHLPYQGRAIDRVALDRIYDRLGDGVADMAIVNRELAREALASMRAHPAETAWLWVQKAWRFLFVDLRPHHLAVRLVGSVALLGVYVFAAIGVRRLWPRASTALRTLGVFLGYYLALHVVTYSQMRFAEPVRPIALAFAAVGLHALWTRRRAAPDARP